MNVFGIGPTELIFILVVALLVLGPSKMLEMARDLGKYVRDFQRFTSDVPKLLSLDDDQPPTPPQRQQVSEQPPKDPSDPTPQESEQPPTELPDTTFQGPVARK